MKATDLTVSRGPHIHSGARVSDTAYHSLLALLPAVILGIFHYGWDAARVIGVSVASAMLAEALMQAIMKRPLRLADGSAAVTGLLLALLLPASIPYYVVIVANFAAIVVGKQVFGGLGTSPLSPVLVGYAVVGITKAWAGLLDFDLALAHYSLSFPIEYPLAVLKAKGAEAVAHFDRASLFLGLQTGGIGASAVICLLAGGLYLVLRGLIRWQITLAYLIGVVAMSGVFWLGDRSLNADPFFHILTGNVMIGAFFLATEYSSSPVNPAGMIAYGLGCGILTVLLRKWSIHVDGVIFSCLLMSLFVPFLDKIKRRQKETPRRPLYPITDRL